MSVLKGTGNVLKTILGGAMERYPIGTPVTLGATAAAGLGVLGNEDSGFVGRNTNNVGEIMSDKENPLQFKKNQIESTYNHEFTKNNNENNFTYMPEMKIEGDRLVVKLNEEPEKHANYINFYAAQSNLGTDNRDIIYEIDGKKHAYDFSVFGGAKFIPLEDLENNPYTKDLPKSNTMSTGDFK